MTTLALFYQSPKIDDKCILLLKNPEDYLKPFSIYDRNLIKENLHNFFVEMKEIHRGLPKEDYDDEEDYDKIPDLVCCYCGDIQVWAPRDNRAEQLTNEICMPGLVCIHCYKKRGSCSCIDDDT